MQPGRHPGSKEGILGSCSVVRKIMSVPCGAVSSDRSQMQPLLYGRLSFSAENSLPPSQTSSKTFSRYCGSLRLKQGEKGGKKAFPLPHPFSSPSQISPGCGGGHACSPPRPGCPLPPSSPPARCEPAADHGKPRTGKRGAAGTGTGQEPATGGGGKPAPLPRQGLAAWTGRARGAGQRGDPAPSGSARGGGAWGRSGTPLARIGSVLPKAAAKAQRLVEACWGIFACPPGGTPRAWAPGGGL